jgi:hypothetical protein
MIPIKDHSTPVPIYRFSEARILSSMPAGFPEHHFIVSLLSDTDEEKAMHAKYPAWDKTHRFIARPHIFARMLAKIGYSLAVAEYGKSKTTAFTPLVTDLILGISDDWTYAIGGSWEIPPPVQGGDHITMINLLVRPFDALIIVNIRLFSQIEMPIYHAVVGSISFKNSEHVRAFEQYRAEGKIENIPLKRP